MIMRSVLRVLAMCFTVTAALAQDIPAAMERGHQARGRNDFVSAESAYAEVTRLSPSNAEAWHLLGLMRGFQGLYERALEALGTAEKLAPKDLDLSLSIARVNGFAGRFSVAEARVEGVIARQPDLQAAWVLKGRLASYQRNWASARTAYERAAALGPPDVDLLVAFGDPARAQNDEAQALTYYQRASALDPASADVKDRLEHKKRADANPWTLSLDVGRSWLTRTPAANWAAIEGTLDRDLGDGTHVFGGASFARRFSANDVMLRAGARGDWGRLGASLELGATPNAHVLPQVQSMGSLTYRVTDSLGFFGPTVAAIDGGLRRYTTGTVKTLMPGIDQYLADGRITLSLRATNTWDITDRHSIGWSARGLWQVTDRLGLRLGYGDAPDADRGIVTDTTTYGAGFIASLTNTLTWHVDVTRESRRGGYRRFEAVTGFALKF